jgi:precorrin-8X/cobalt-precorrin-8 methylmutase
MLFDAYIMVDWSAGNAPRKGKDSIWIANWQSGTPIRPPTNPRTRQLAFDEVLSLLRSHTDAGRRVLIGFDFPYGYPSGFAEGIGLPRSTASWRRVWDTLQAEIRDDEGNRNNRFEVAAKLNAKIGKSPGPFWGAPAGYSGVPAKKPVFPYVAEPDTTLSEYRRSEEAMRHKKGRVHSVWQLWTAGSVGSQALTGIPRVAALRNHPELATHSSVWPFETGFTIEPTAAGRSPSIVHAEIWPGIVALNPSLHLIKDAAQVLTLVHHFASLDARGALGHLFEEPATGALDRPGSIIEEEGWILGV